MLRTTDFGAFRVEHVVYESRPGFLVTANLFLPARVDGRIPAVLFACGHSHNGKAYMLYAKTCMRLAMTGMAALIYDPINQGERDLYSLLKVKDRPTREGSCTGHNIIGKQLSACGDWFGQWRVWDGMRGVDYLRTRREIDSARIGVAGQSGGGTLSAYLFAMDLRLKAVASSCWTTSCLLDLENSMPTDNEQCPPGFLMRGLDKIDYFISRAPHSACLLGQERDFFDDRGLKAGYAELQRIHGLLGGSPDLCRLSMDTVDHSLRDPCQVDLVAFFCDAFDVSAQGRGAKMSRIRVPGTKTIVSLRGVDKALDDERFWQVTPKCDVNRFGSTPMYTLVARQVRNLGATRRRVASAGLAGIVRKALRIRIPEGSCRIIVGCSTRGRNARPRDRILFRFIVESEPGIPCVLRRVCRGGMPYRLDPGREVRVYLPNVSSQADLEDKGTMRGFAEFWALERSGDGGRADPGTGPVADLRARVHDERARADVRRVVPAGRPRVRRIERDPGLAGGRSAPGACGRARAGGDPGDAGRPGGPGHRFGEQPWGTGVDRTDGVRAAEFLAGREFSVRRSALFRPSGRAEGAGPAADGRHPVRCGSIRTVISQIRLAAVWVAGKSAGYLVFFDCHLCFPVSSSTTTLSSGSGAEGGRCRIKLRGWTSTFSGVRFASASR